MGDRGVKSSRAAVGGGWVTTGVSRLASVWRGLGGVSRRIGRFGACWRGTRRVGSSPPVEGAGRRLAPHIRVRLLLAEACPWGVSPPLAEACPRCRSISRGRLLLAGACPWDVSPPLTAEAWSPVQTHLAAMKYLLQRQLWYSVLI